MPEIPNDIIIEEINKHGIEPVSTITDVKAALSGPRFSHILSFRRQIYIKEEDEPKIKDIQNLQLKVNNATHWIYLSTEKLVCFVCNNEGHLAKYCSQAENSATNSTAPASLPPSKNPQEPLKKEIPTKPSKSPEIQIKMPNLVPAPTSQVKRTFSAVSTSTKSESSSVKKVPRITEQATVPDIEVFKTKLQPAENYLNELDPEKDLNFEKIANLFKDTFGQQKVLPIVDQYTEDRAYLDEILSDVHQLVEDRSTKVRITKLRNRIKNPALEQKKNSRPTGDEQQTSDSQEKDEEEQDFEDEDEEEDDAEY